MTHPFILRLRAAAYLLAYPETRECLAWNWREAGLHGMIESFRDDLELTAYEIAKGRL